MNTGASGPLLLTGASGWFGRTALWEYEREHGPEALRRDVVPFASRECWVEFDSPHGPVKALPLQAITQVRDPRGLLHLAFLTRDKVETLGWQRYVESNRAITAMVAQVLQAWPGIPVVITSSGAAAALDGRGPDLEGNPYATLKKEEEALLEREATTRMAVVFRVYAATGRFMTRPEKFALGDFILQAMNGQTIQVRAPHAVWRSYVSSELLMRLSWSLLLGTKETHGLQRVDACGEGLELEDLAAAVGSELGASVDQRRIRDDSHADRYGGDGEAFRRMVQRHGLAPVELQEQIRDTIRGLQPDAGD